MAIRFILLYIKFRAKKYFAAIKDFIPCYIE